MSRLDVSILLFDAFSNMVLACLLEPLRVVRDQTGARISWTILTSDDRPLCSSSGITVAPDRAQSDAPRPDLTLIVGGDVFRDLIPTPALRRRLGHLTQAPTVIAADTGAWMMARCGYLDGRAVTLHWQLLDEFAETFAQVRVLPDRFVQDGRFWTCGSASAALDLMLAYIRDRFGPVAAFDAGAMFLHDTARRFGVSYPDQALVLHGSARLKRVVQVMSETLERPVPIAGLARTANISERSLHRRFLAELHMTPGRYYLLLRLARARELAQHSDLSLTDIALRCGFASATTLTRSFRKQHGTNLRALRGG